MLLIALAVLAQQQVTTIAPTPLSSVPKPAGYDPFANRSTTNGHVTIDVSRPLDSLSFPPVTPGPHRNVVEVRLLTADRGAISLGRFAGPERYFHLSGQKGGDGPRPLGKKPVVAITNDRVFVGTSDSFVVQVFDLNGKPAGTIRAAIPARPVTPAMQDAYLRDRLPNTREYDAEFRAWLPATLPAYDRFVTAGSVVWIQEGLAPTDTVAQWRGFDPTGKAVGILRVPRRFAVHEIEKDTALGVWSENAVDSVRRYRLVRSTTK